jgi:hypothetical protein
MVNYMAKTQCPVCHMVIKSWAEECPKCGVLLEKFEPRYIKKHAEERIVKGLGDNRARNGSAAEGRK